MTHQDYKARVQEFADIIDSTRELLAVENVYEVFVCTLMEDLRVAAGISDEDDERIWDEVFPDNEEE